MSRVFRGIEFFGPYDVAIGFVWLSFSDDGAAEISGNEVREREADRSKPALSRAVKNCKITTAGDG
jgi:hypothetical protein